MARQMGVPPRMSGQSRKHSVAETVANVAVGYVVAMAAQMTILPLFGVHISHAQNLSMGAVFTAVSIVRSYVLRRVFNVWAGR